MEQPSRTNPVLPNRTTINTNGHDPVRVLAVLTGTVRQVLDNLNAIRVLSDAEARVLIGGDS